MLLTYSGFLDSILSAHNRQAQAMQIVNVLKVTHKRLQVGEVRCRQLPYRDIN